MKEFFKVTDLQQVLAHAADFPRVETEDVPLDKAAGRILAEDIISDVDLPDFRRATMDGYAVKAASTFGSTEGNPAFFTIKGIVEMGEFPKFSIAPGQAAKISTGGVLPDGTDSVVMIEHTEAVDNITIEVYKSVAPGQNVIAKGEDFQKGDIILSCGRKLRSQETGLLAAFGRETIRVFRRPAIAIISTGDEVVPINAIPGPGQIRDINSYTLATLAQGAGGVPITLGIVGDNFGELFESCTTALAQSDMVLISGGSSVGTRDFTVEVLSALPDAGILVHGISISPGKPTILARSGNHAIWGLPGHVVSTMVVFEIVVRPFIERIAGLAPEHKKIFRPSALLSRNLSSAQGRIDYVRVRLIAKEGVLWAEPILGKSGLIHTMVKADGLIEIGINSEGLNKGTVVDVILI